MQNLRSLIASPSALFAFEAAGRRISDVVDHVDAGQAGDATDVHQHRRKIHPPRLRLRHQVGSAGEYADFSRAQDLRGLGEGGR